MGGDLYGSESAGGHGGAEVLDPFGERPLLTPAMTAGHDAVPEEERRRLRSYLEAVVAVRPAPVHTAVAFNAVYFGYDLGGDGYGGSPLSPDAFPVISLGESAPVLPVGAMVCIATGSDPLFAEIVHKEAPIPNSVLSERSRPGCRGLPPAPKDRAGPPTPPCRAGASGWCRTCTPSDRS